MNKVAQRLQLAPAHRFRCFHREEMTANPCLAMATKHAPDPLRADASTFYCDEHAPEYAESIAENETFTAIELGAVLVLGASTARRADMAPTAIAIVTKLLADHGIRIQVVGSAAARMAPW